MYHDTEPKKYNMHGVMHQKAMMHREAYWVGQFVAGCKHEGAHVQIHSDKNRVGVPDTSIGWFGRDSWIEWKLQRVPDGKKPRHSLLKYYTLQQHEWLSARGKTNGDNCYVAGVAESEDTGKFIGCWLVPVRMFSFEEKGKDSFIKGLSIIAMPDMFDIAIILSAISRQSRGRM